jgi:hypothetical protein
MAWIDRKLAATLLLHWAQKLSNYEPPSEAGLQGAKASKNPLPISFHTSLSPLLLSTWECFPAGVMLIGATIPLVLSVTSSSRRYLNLGGWFARLNMTIQPAVPDLMVPIMLRGYATALSLLSFSSGHTTGRQPCRTLYPPVLSVKPPPFAFGYGQYHRVTTMVAFA